MHTKLLSLLTMLFTANIAFAQTQSLSPQDIQSMSKELRHHHKLQSLIPKGIHVDVKKTRVGSRLIATATGDVVSTLPLTTETSDSAHFYFKSNYGYDVTANMFAGNYDLNQFATKNQHHYDSTYRWMDDGLGNLVDYDSATCQFSSNHKLAIEQTTYFGLGYYGSQSYNYNGSEQRVLDIDSSIIGTDTMVQKYTYTYDGFNHLKTLRYDEWDAATQTYIPTYLDTLFYDANFNMTSIHAYEYDVPSSSWVKAYLTSLTYNAANKLTNDISQYWDAAANLWVNDYQTNNVYNGSNQLVSSTDLSWDLSLLNWVYESKDSFQYATSQYPSVVINQSWDGTNLVNSMKDEYTYNASNQILKDDKYFWDGTNWTYYSISNYYYETFIPNAVKEVVNTAGSIKVYPVPVSGNLHIEANWDNAQAATIKISDMTGKVLMNIDQPTGKQINQSIDMSSLPNGMYIIQLVGENGLMTQKFTKQ